MVGGAPATWGSPRVLVIPVAAVPMWSGVWSWEGRGGGKRERERERERGREGERERGRNKTH